MANPEAPEAHPDPNNKPSPDLPTPGERAEQRDKMAESGIATPKIQQGATRQLRLDMMRSFITEPLLSEVSQAVAVKDPERPFDVIISLNEVFSGGLDGALQWVKKRADEWNVKGYRELSQYIFATLTAQQVLDLAEEARQLTIQYGSRGSVIYRIWEDTDISVTLTRSLTTVKADAAQRAFQANGDRIVWAVLDSGIQGDHPHFKQSSNLSPPPPVVHMDFTPDGRLNGPAPQKNDMGLEVPVSHPTASVDRFGHGTHVSGIIAGCWQSSKPEGELVTGAEMRSLATDDAIPHREMLQSISGVAPRTKLVSLKVIADIDRTDDPKQKAGQGKVSWVLEAIDQIQTWNQNGKRILVHGVNMSLGYDFSPRWFACGQSPICLEVDRLVRSGVCVVVSAGNGGYSSYIVSSGQVQSKYTDLSITDPGNAELAITVGSTHREMPHIYGVSYFSSRGPTGDGRLKPDLLAPGERIISCAAGLQAKKYGPKDALGNDVPPVLYCEQSGTSMAAPHVSGAIAAFLSVRSEYIGRPEDVKAVFLANTIDLRRERSFQGAGLLDVMKVLQAV